MRELFVSCLINPLKKLQFLFETGWSKGLEAAGWGTTVCFRLVIFFFYLELNSSLSSGMSHLLKVNLTHAHEVDWFSVQWQAAVFHKVLACLRTFISPPPPLCWLARAWRRSPSSPESVTLKRCCRILCSGESAPSLRARRVWTQSVRQSGHLFAAPRVSVRTDLENLQYVMLIFKFQQNI